VSYEEAGAYLLAAEAAVLARPETLAAIREVLARLADEDAPPLGQILAEEARWDQQGARRRFLHRVFRVFSAGLAQ